MKISREFQRSSNANIYHLGGQGSPGLTQLWGVSTKDGECLPREDVLFSPQVGGGCADMVAFKVQLVFE